MASITREANGGYQIQFVGVDRRRRSVRLGTVKPKMVELIKLRIEQIVDSQKAGVRFDADLTQWLNDLADRLHEKLARVGLVEPRVPKERVGLKEFLDAFVERRSDVKPATREVWKQPIRNLIEHFGAKRDIASICEADALDLRQFLMGSRLAPATVAKRLQFARTFFHDARRRKLISINPFAEVSSKAVVRLDERRFHALRSSRKTELAQEFPIHVITAGLGNTPTIAMRTTC